MRKPYYLRFTDQFFAPLVGVMIFVYLLVFLFAVPDNGFTWDNNTYKIRWINPDHPQSGIDLKVGDTIQKIGDVDFDDFMKPSGPDLRSLYNSQNMLTITIDRAGQSQEIQWGIYPISAANIRDRILFFFPAFVFLLSALLLQLVGRPRRITQRLLLAVFCLMALWIAAGTIKTINLLYSDYVFLLAIWLWVPTFLHLMWFYPYPLATLPAKTIALAYSIALLFALLEMMAVLPPNTFRLGFAFGILGGFVLLLLHFLRRKLPAAI